MNLATIFLEVQIWIMILNFLLVYRYRSLACKKLTYSLAPVASNTNKICLQGRRKSSQLFFGEAL